jgi:hypothetical protein
MYPLDFVDEEQEIIRFVMQVELSGELKESRAWNVVISVDHNCRKKWMPLAVFVG